MTTRIHGQGQLIQDLDSSSPPPPQPSYGGGTVEIAQPRSPDTGVKVASLDMEICLCGTTGYSERYEFDEIVGGDLFGIITKYKDRDDGCQNGNVLSMGGVTGDKEMDTQLGVQDRTNTSLLLPSSNQMLQLEKARRSSAKEEVTMKVNNK